MGGNANSVKALEAVQLTACNRVQICSNTTSSTAVY